MKDLGMNVLGERKGAFWVEERAQKISEVRSQKGQGIKSHLGIGRRWRAHSEKSKGTFYWADTEGFYSVM